MSGLFGGVDMPEGMSADDRKGLLEYENTLAGERDAKARQFQRDQDRLRQSQETEIRKATELQEAERIRSLEEQEALAAGVAIDPAQEAQQDRDSRLSQMWGSLGAGQEADTQNVEEQRPE